MFIVLVLLCVRWWFFKGDSVYSRLYIYTRNSTIIYHMNGINRNSYLSIDAINVRACIAKGVVIA